MINKFFILIVILMLSDMKKKDFLKGFLFEIDIIKQRILNLDIFF